MELLVQNKLKSGVPFQELIDEHGIEISQHPSLPLAIFNYSQINSKKTDLLASQCRALCLELDTWKPIARSFQRFFNLGEMLDEQQNFNWENFTYNAKVDGSLLNLFNYRGQWRINTRGSFADGKIVDELDYTWSSLFWEILNSNNPILSHLDPRLTYAIELCSIYNKVVQTHKEPHLVLLSCFNTEDGQEKSSSYSDGVALYLGIRRPQIWGNSFEDAHKWLEEQPDSTFEGFVLRDDKDMRIKVKSKRYVALHQLKGNGNLFLTKNLLPFVLRPSPDIDEILSVYPEAKPKYRAMQLILFPHKATLSALWEKTKGIENQKEFALAIKDHPLKAFLFTLRKDAKKRNFDELWIQMDKLFLDVLFPKNWYGDEKQVIEDQAA